MNRQGKIRSVGRQLEATRRRVEAVVGTQERQLQLLKDLGEITGSTFSAFNLCDTLGRVFGGVAWPFTPDKERLVVELFPTLKALIAYDEVQDYFMDGDFGKVKALPATLYHGSALYQEVYRHLGMEYAAWYFYPRFENGDIVIVGISSSKREFDAAALRRFDRFCKEFESEIVAIEPTGKRLPVLSVRPADHRISLDAKLIPIDPISDYLLAALIYFYGGKGSSANSLPEALLAEANQLRSSKREGSILAASNEVLAWSRRCRGRQLNLVLEVAGKGFELRAHEDHSVSRRLQRLRLACQDLKRDGATVFAVIQALLDGARTDSEVIERACIGALKESSARRILSKARSMVGVV